MRPPRDRKEPGFAAGSASTAALPHSPLLFLEKFPLSVDSPEGGGVGPAARWTLDGPVSAVGPTFPPADRPSKIQEEECMFPTA